VYRLRPGQRDLRRPAALLATPTPSFAFRLCFSPGDRVGVVMAPATAREDARQPVRLPYQTLVSSTFLSEQNSHQQPASSTFFSEQTSNSHQPPGKRTGYRWGRWDGLNAAAPSSAASCAVWVGASGWLALGSVSSTGFCRCCVLCMAAAPARAGAGTRQRDPPPPPPPTIFRKSKRDSESLTASVPLERDSSARSPVRSMQAEAPHVSKQAIAPISLSCSHRFPHVHRGLLQPRASRFICRRRAKPHPFEVAQTSISRKGGKHESVQQLNSIRPIDRIELCISEK
jgi:hypothetical protein